MCHHPSSLLHSGLPPRASEQLCAPSQVVAHSSNGGGDQDAPGSRRGMQRIPSLASSSVPMLR